MWHGLENLLPGVPRRPAHAQAEASDHPQRPQGQWSFKGRILNNRVHNNVTDVRIITSFVQIENLLISNQGTIKLCDFGSSTTVSHYPDYSWSAQKRSMVEDEVCI